MLINGILKNAVTGMLATFFNKVCETQGLFSAKIYVLSYMFHFVVEVIKASPPPGKSFNSMDFIKSHKHVV